MYFVSPDYKWTTSNITFFILGNLNRPTSQIWESDFDRFMTTKHGNPIVRQQSNLSWTEQFLDGKKKNFI